MTRSLSILALAAFGLTALSGRTAADKYWRVGGSLAMPTSDSVRGLIGNGWGVVGEYSFTHDQPKDDQWRGDLTFGISYRRFDRNTAPSQNTIDWTTFGLRWRGGAGASPGRQGMYAGVGVGAAILRIQPAFDGVTEHIGVTKLEYSAFGGGNIGERVYLEVGYYATPDIQDVPLRNVTFTLGFRF